MRRSMRVMVFENFSPSPQEPEVAGASALEEPPHRSRRFALSSDRTEDRPGISDGGARAHRPWSPHGALLPAPRWDRRRVAHFILPPGKIPDAAGQAGVSAPHRTLGETSRTLRAASVSP